MKECLNKRIRNYEISSSNAEESFSKKLHKELNPKKDQLPTYADAWRDQNVASKIAAIEKSDFLFEEVLRFFDELYFIDQESADLMLEEINDFFDERYGSK